MTSRCAMLIECKYWMASPMLFMISDASGAVRQEKEKHKRHR